MYVMVKNLVVFNVFMKIKKVGCVLVFIGFFDIVFMYVFL